MRSKLYDELANEIRNIAATRDLSAGDITNLSDAAWIIDSLQSRVEQLQKDADRYRWLCDGNGYFMEENFLCGHGNGKDRADKIIDKAMQESK